MHWLDPVRAALEAKATGVFFRDDDAGWAADRLCAVLDRFERHGLPVDVAVIPAALDRRLAAELRRRAATQRLGLHQHGYAHRNHEPDGRKYEFGSHRPAGRQRRDIAAGAARLDDLLGGLTQPVFTPPWNRCTADTGRCLTELGFVVLSRESRAEPLGIAGLAEVPIHVDWVKPDAPARLAAAIAADGPVGVMFHHATMDEEDYGHLDELLALLASHPHAGATTIYECSHGMVDG